MNAFSVSIWPWAVGALLFLLSNALIVAAELALLRVRLSHFDQGLVDRLEERKSTRDFVNHTERTVRTLRSAGFFSVGLFVLSLLKLADSIFFHVHRAWGPLAGDVAGVLTLFLGAGFFLLFGVMLPRVIGLRHPERVLVNSRFILYLFTPLRHLVVDPMRILIRRFLRFFGVRDIPGLDSLAFEEQIESDDPDSAMPDMARRIFSNALQMRGLVVSDVLLPRHQVQWMDLGDSIHENMKLARRTGHTRFPLCDGDLDRCVGLVHVKDIFRSGVNPRNLDLRRVRRDILRISPDMSVEDAMQMLLARRQHMALVVDEFRGVEGIVTLERLLELLVGDIKDEFDVEEDNIRPVPNGDLHVSGLTPVYELERRLDMEFSNKDVSTFGGLITSELGRIPVRGERLSLDGLEIVVTEVDERRVIAARVSRPPEAQPESE